MEGDYVERALIRLRRQYEKDEVLGAIIKQVRERELEIGQLKSEIDFLQHALTTSENLTEVKKRALVELKKNREVKKMKKQLDQLQKQVDELKKNEKAWLEKNLKLQFLLKEKKEGAGDKI